VLIVKDFLNGDNIGLKEIVRARTEQNNLDIICPSWGHTNGVCRSSSDPSHDGDDDMLLNGERPRIKRDTEEGSIRQVASPGLANWETQQHGETLIIDLATGPPKGRPKRRGEIVLRT
jgi:hypothetical protein